MVSLLKGLTEEKIVMVKNSQKLPFPSGAVVRFVDQKGRTLGIVLNREMIEEIEEEIESKNPEFLASLETSRRSGRISGAEVKRKIGLK